MTVAFVPPKPNELTCHELSDQEMKIMNLGKRDKSSEDQMISETIGHLHRRGEGPGSAKAWAHGGTDSLILAKCSNREEYQRAGTHS